MSFQSCFLRHFNQPNECEGWSGPAVDFCELITQRRNIADLALEVIGDDAAKWASIAQAFAGPPGGGREPAANDLGGEHV